MDRFKNSHEKEYSWCEGCNKKVHYEELDSYGFCRDCHEAIELEKKLNKEIEDSQIERSNDVTK